MISLNSGFDYTYAHYVQEENTSISFFGFLDVYIEPFCPSVVWLGGQLIGRSVGQSVLPLFPKMGWKLNYHAPVLVFIE